jgi:hypothetical protein
MFFHHQDNPHDLFKHMEDSGYGTLEPAITPRNLKELCKDDPVLLTCYEQMNTYCIRYAHDVFNMMYEQKKLEEFREKNEDTKEMYDELRIIDKNRHTLHEAMMDSVNLLSRQLAKQEKDIEWMREVSSGGRASYAKFAILTFYNIYSKI